VTGLIQRTGPIMHRDYLHNCGRGRRVRDRLVVKAPGRSYPTALALRLAEHNGRRCPHSANRSTWRASPATQHLDMPGRRANLSTIVFGVARERAALPEPGAHPLDQERWISGFEKPRLQPSAPHTSGIGVRPDRYAPRPCQPTCDVPISAASARQVGSADGCRPRRHAHLGTATVGLAVGLDVEHRPWTDPVRPTSGVA